MEPGITIQPPPTLRSFCEHVIATHSVSWPPDENILSQEFVSSFQVNGFISLGDLERLCRQLGIVVSVQLLPSGLRGHNCVYREEREIVVGTVEGPTAVFGSREHTLLHELRELMEYEFHRLGCPTANGAHLESRAEMFASSVRTLSALHGLKPLFDGVSELTSTWKQVGAILLLIIAALVSSYSYFALPRLEDRLK